MPKINMQEYENATPLTGEYASMGAGGYVCAIQAVRVNGKDYNGNFVDYVKDKEYVKLIWDVVEGEFAGRFSDDYWQGEDKDYGHQTFLSWKNMGMFKNFIQCLEESNPGFDAMAAFEADNWAMFIGKKFGAVFGEEEYRANNGEIKKRLRLPNIKSVADIHAGKFRIPQLKKLNESQDGYLTQPANSNDDVYSDVPF